MKTALIIILVVIVLGVIGYFVFRGYKKSSNDKSPAIETNTVEIKNLEFTPTNISIKANTTITFTNNDSIKHNVVSDNNSFNEQSIDSGQSAKITISNPGTYDYHCSIHPSMTGSIIVK